MRTSHILRNLLVSSLIVTQGGASDPRLMKRIIIGEDETSTDIRLKVAPGVGDDHPVTAMEAEGSGEYGIMPISLDSPVITPQDSMNDEIPHESEVIAPISSEYLRATIDDGTAFPRSFVMSFAERGTVTFIVGSRQVFGYGPHTLSRFTVLETDRTVEIEPVTTVQKVAEDNTERVVSVAGVTTVVSLDGITTTWGIEPATSVYTVEGTEVTLTVPESTAYYTMWGDTFSLRLPGAQTVASVPGVSTTVVIPGASTVVTVPGKVSTVVVSGTTTTVPDGTSEDVTLVRSGTREVVAISSEVSHSLEVPEGAVTLDRPMSEVVLYAPAAITTYWVSGPDTTVSLSESKAVETTSVSETTKIESTSVEPETSSKKEEPTSSSPSSSSSSASTVTTSVLHSEAPKMTTIYSVRVYSTTETFVTELFGTTTTIKRPTVVTENVAVRTEEVTGTPTEQRPASSTASIEVQTKNGAASAAVPLEAVLALVAFLL